MRWWESKNKFERVTSSMKLKVVVSSIIVLSLLAVSGYSLVQPKEEISVAQRYVTK